MRSAREYCGLLLLAGFAWGVAMQGTVLAEAQGEKTVYALSDDVRQKCLQVLREGLKSDEFWPSIHAAEALTLAGHGDDVRKALEPKLLTENDDQRRCGLARELARAGDRAQASLLL